MTGVVLALRHPEVAWRDCRRCQQYVFDHESGKELTDRAGNPIERPKGTRPPCGYSPDKCAKRSPDAGLGLSLKNRGAYEHYMRCKATGRFPDDPIVAHCAGLIRQMEDACDAESQRIASMTSLLIALRR